MFIPHPLTQDQQAKYDEINRLYDIFMAAEPGTQEAERAGHELFEYVFAAR